jgi:hypothetical protein
MQCGTVAAARKVAPTPDISAGIKSTRGRAVHEMCNGARAHREGRACWGRVGGQGAGADQAVADGGCQIFFQRVLEPRLKDGEQHLEQGLVAAGQDEHIKVCNLETCCDSLHLSHQDHSTHKVGRQGQHVSSG